MDFCYYNSQIDEELEGAKFYTEKSIAAKDSHPDWSQMYSKMAEAEIDHATNLVRIFEDDLRESRSEDPIYSQIHDSIIKKYSETVAMIRLMSGR